jgi:hypothetical protein
MKQRGRLVELAPLETTQAPVSNEVIAAVGSQREGMWNSVE